MHYIDLSKLRPCKSKWPMTSPEKYVTALQPTYNWVQIIVATLLVLPLVIDYLLVSLVCTSKFGFTLICGDALLYYRGA